MYNEKKWLEKCVGSCLSALEIALHINMADRPLLITIKLKYSVENHLWSLPVCLLPVYFLYVSLAGFCRGDGCKCRFLFEFFLKTNKKTKKTNDKNRANLNTMVSR